MSRKPSKKSKSKKADVEEPTEPDIEDEIEEGDDVADDSVEGDDQEQDDEEFSLDLLSQAYAKVLKEKGEPVAEIAEDNAEEPGDDLPAEEGKVDGADDNAACPISPESIIESILFVGAPKDVKLNSRKVAAVLRDVSPKEVTKAVHALNAKYEKENAAYRIESDGGVFKMILSPDLNDFQQDFFGRNREARLSQSAIDVMAVVAYNQPTTKAQVEKILPRSCGAVLSQLVRRELLSVEPGATDPKVRYYSTTERFLDLFGLDELADLPQTHDVSDIEELAD